MAHGNRRLLPLPDRKQVPSGLYAAYSAVFDQLWPSGGMGAQVRSSCRTVSESVSQAVSPPARSDGPWTAMRGVESPPQRGGQANRRLCCHQGTPLSIARGSG